MSSESKTAVLFFTRSEVSEVREKSFGLDRKKSLLLAKSLITRTRNLLKDCSFPVFEIGAENDAKNGFVQAIESIWALGFDRIISLGNDCPQLTIDHLTQANNLLHSNGLVAGPDHRGGVYLLGIRKSAYDRHFFLNLPWHTNRFYDYLKTHPESQKSLPALHDLNNKTDLFKALKTSGSRLIRFLLFLLRGKVVRSFLSINPVYLSPIVQVSKRGPPALAY